MGRSELLANPLLVVHERLGFWARQLRPLFRELPVRIVETRSACDLEPVLSGTTCPLLVVDAARRVRASLEDLVLALRVAPDALALVLADDPGNEFTLLARRLGATHVIAGPVRPHEVASLLSRWLTLAQRRADAAGWQAPGPPRPEPWNWLEPLLLAAPGAEWTARDGAGLGPRVDDLC
jgi:hypothetical protein